ncbi:MAG: hemin receptor [Candidatus Kapabacteria bacterium]|nr:hemin receptor [Candidatus Kapabacteria bacterium]
MTQTEIKYVQDTFMKVLPISDAAATLFYDRLFELDPSTKALFSNMAKQKKVLMDTLKTVVYSLHEFDTVRPAVRELGKRHVRYHVEERHYATVGQALLYALEKGLGSDFTPEVKQAWASAYTFLANTMKEAAKEVPVK